MGTGSLARVGRAVSEKSGPRMEKLAWGWPLRSEALGTRAKKSLPYSGTALVSKVPWDG
jgi:hypothetical protein